MAPDAGPGARARAGARRPCGLAFLGKSVTHMWDDDGAVRVQTDLWRNASLAPERLPTGEGVNASSSATRLCQDDPSVGGRAGAPPGA